MAVNKIVARYNDGRMLKGSTQNFDTANGFFHLIPEPGNGSGNGKAVEVYMRDLKAVFFVADFAGKPDYEEVKDFTEAPGTQGRRLKISFKDGEIIVGTTLNFDAGGVGFFAIPADPKSNNQRIFVVNTAVKEVTLI